VLNINAPEVLCSKDEVKNILIIILHAPVPLPCCLFVFMHLLKLIVETHLKTAANL